MLNDSNNAFNHSFMQIYSMMHAFEFFFISEGGWTIEYVTDNAGLNSNTNEVRKPICKGIEITCTCSRGISQSLKPE